MARVVVWVPAVAVAGALTAWLIAAPPWFGADTASPVEVCPIARAPGTPAARPVPYSGGAADYGGAAPHPIEVITTDDTGRLSDGSPLTARWGAGDDPAWEVFRVPDEWDSAADDQDRSEVQLVACVQLDAIEPLQTECHYQHEDGTFEIAAARLTVVVREASTGHEVGSFPLRSDPAKADPAKLTGPYADEFRSFLKTEYCPLEIPEGYVRGEHTWLVPPSRAEFHAGLRPWVEKQF